MRAGKNYSQDTIIHRKTEKNCKRTHQNLQSSLLSLSHLNLLHSLLILENHQPKKTQKTLSLLTAFYTLIHNRNHQFFCNCFILHQSSSTFEPNSSLRFLDLQSSTQHLSSSLIQLYHDTFILLEFLLQPSTNKLQQIFIVIKNLKKLISSILHP